MSGIQRAIGQKFQISLSISLSIVTNYGLSESLVFFDFG